MGTQVTGCEHKHEIQCHVHLHPVDRGNGRADATCCVYKGKTYLLLYLRIFESTLIVTLPVNNQNFIHAFSHISLN